MKIDLDEEEKIAYEVDDERRQNASDVSHDVDEGNALRPDDCWKQLSRILKSDIVGNVHAEASQNSQSSRGST